MEHRLIKFLKPHPLNTRIYGDTFDADLLEEIKKNGIMTPIIITGDDIILSGHRRVEAARVLKFETVPVEVYEGLDDDRQIEILIALNVQREKTTAMKAREGKYLKEIEEKRAADRMKATQFGSTAVVNLSQPQAEGKAREIAGAKVGMSGTTLDKAIDVIDAIDAISETEPEKAQELTDTLNKSVAGAHKKIGKEPKKPRAKRKSQEIFKLEIKTDADQFMVMAISQLERIQMDDPGREAALRGVIRWAKQQLRKE